MAWDGIRGGDPDNRGFFHGGTLARDRDIHFKNRFERNTVLSTGRQIHGGELQRCSVGFLLVSFSLLLVLQLLYGGCARLLGDSINPFADPFATLAFNRQDWLEDADCSDSSNRRGHMARDIVGHLLHKGMTKAETKDLLGEPGERENRSNILASLAENPRRYHPVPVPQANTAMIYYLGQDLGLMHGVGRAWLHLYFDADNRFVGWSIWQP